MKPSQDHPKVLKNIRAAEKKRDWVQNTVLIRNKDFFDGIFLNTCLLGVRNFNFTSGDIPNIRARCSVGLRLCHSQSCNEAVHRALIYGSCIVISQKHIVVK